MFINTRLNILFNKLNTKLSSQSSRKVLTSNNIIVSAQMEKKTCINLYLFYLCY